MPGRTFHEKSVGARAIVVAAGPIANFLLAMVLFAALFATAGQPVTLPVVGEVLPDSAADACRAGRRATASSPSTAQPINDFEDIQRIVVGACRRETLPLTCQQRGDTT